MEMGGYYLRWQLCVFVYAACLHSSFSHGETHMAIDRALWVKTDLLISQAKSISRNIDSQQK